jgi:hypothetical protein
LINRDIALMSASWEDFRSWVLKLCGCKSIQEFVNKMMDSEQSQLQLFVNYIINSNLDDELQNLDFKGFARSYNGPCMKEIIMLN